MGDKNEKGERVREYSELVIKLSPFIVGFVYVTGYLVSLIFFRSIKIPTVDLLKASCLETGITFFLLSFTIIGLLALFPAVYIAISKGVDFLPKNSKLMQGGIWPSVLSFVLIYLSSIYLTLFLPPNKFPDISGAFIKLLLFGVVGFLFVIFTEKLAGRLLVGHEVSEVIFSKGMFLIRIVVLGIVCWFTWKIFFVELKGQVPIFQEPRMLYYLLFLSLVLLLAARLARHLRHPTNYSKAAVVLYTPILGICFYLTVLAFVFGPFPYIPTSRGGGWYYQSAVLVYGSEGVPSEGELFNGSRKSKPVFVLAEVENYVYVADFTENSEPAQLFKYLHHADVHQINTEGLEEILFLDGGRD